jgi:hypothetical protein
MFKSLADQFLFWSFGYVTTYFRGAPTLPCRSIINLMQGFIIIFRLIIVIIIIIINE